MTGFWPIVFAIGAAQGIFLCGVLLLRRAGNPIATRLLAALVAVATAMIVTGALSTTLPAPLELFLVFVNINTELAIGPLLLLFARSLMDPTRRLHRGDLLHFIPLTAGTVLWILAWLILGNDARRDAFMDSPVVPVYVVLKAAWLYTYVVAVYRTLRDDDRIARMRATGQRTVQLSWLRHGLLIMAGLAGTIYVSDLAVRVGVPLPYQSDPLGSLILAVMIYMASLMVLQRPWVLALRARPAEGHRWQADAARLTAHLEDGRSWLQPDLSLGDLARALGWSDHHLSAVIREGLDTTFYALVNRYRLAEFERLARDPELRHRSVLELAYEAGFNSKASFYRAFRESHGTTPTAFRDAVSA